MPSCHVTHVMFEQQKARQLYNARYYLFYFEIATGSLYNLTS